MLFSLISRKNVHNVKQQVIFDDEVGFVPHQYDIGERTATDNVTSFRKCSFPESIAKTVVKINSTLDICLKFVFFY
jgi:hypothetical protein